MTTMLLAVVAVPLAVALVVACLREPMRIALPLFALLIPFGKGLSLGSSPYSSLSSLAGFLLGIALLLQLVTVRRSGYRIPPDVPIWLLFLGTAAATALWTIDRTATLSGLLVLGSLILVYALAALSHVDRTVLRRTENALIAGGVAVVGYGLAQLFILGGFPKDVATGGGVGAGRFGNGLLGPNIESVALLLPLGLALSRVFSESSHTRRLVNATAAALLLAGILMTGSRTGSLAAVLVLVTLAWSGPRRARRGLLVTLGLALAAGALVWVFQPAGVADRTYGSATASSGRVDIWQVGLAGCARYCVAGSGWGTFPEVYADTQASVPGARVLVGPQGSYQPHNLWLLAAVELGLSGLLLLAAGLALAFAEALRLPRQLRGPPLSALVGLLLGVFFLSSMEFKFFWMLLIMIALYRNLSLAEGRNAPVATPDPVALGVRSG